LKPSLVSVLDGAIDVETMTGVGAGTDVGASTVGVEAVDRTVQAEAMIASADRSVGRFMTNHPALGRLALAPPEKKNIFG